MKLIKDFRFLEFHNSTEFRSLLYRFFAMDIFSIVKLPNEVLVGIQHEYNYSYQRIENFLTVGGFIYDKLHAFLKKKRKSIVHTLSFNQDGSVLVSFLGFPLKYKLLASAIVKMGHLHVVEDFDPEEACELEYTVTNTFGFGAKYTTVLENINIQIEEYAQDFISKFLNKGSTIVDVHKIESTLVEFTSTPEMSFFFLLSVFLLYGINNVNFNNNLLMIQYDMSSNKNRFMTWLTGVGSNFSNGPVYIYIRV